MYENVPGYLVHTANITRRERDCTCHGYEGGSNRAHSMRAQNQLTVKDREEDC